MTLDEHIQQLVLAAVREALPAIREELGRPRMVPIKDAPVGYRQILAAEKAGELRVFRVGHASLVDEAELHAWIRRTGVATKIEPTDEVGELVEASERRRAGRAKR